MAKKKSSKFEIENYLYTFATKFHLNYLGIIFGLACYGLALTPSLQPRSWMLQGLICGVAFGVGYGLGSFLSWLARFMTESDAKPKTKQTAWNILAIVFVPIVLLINWQSSIWQSELRQLTNFEGQSNYYLVRMMVVTIVIGWIVVIVSKLFRRFFYWVIKKLNSKVPPRISVSAGFGATLVLLILIFNGVLFDGFIGISRAIYQPHNQSDPEGYDVPPWPEHSGSSQSVIPWDTLGFQGKKFVASTSTTEEMTAFSGEPSIKSIRLYAGLDSAPTPQERTDLLIQEINRTKAFDREVLVVVTPTGTGWVEPNAIRAIEHMYGGDVAVVSQQYSYLPSWITTLADRSSATETGKILFDTVYDEWSRLPESNRPELITHGLSLGSYGGQAAFSGLHDFEARTDGGLFLGTPSFSEPWSRFTHNRDKGSLMIRPVFDNREVVVFASDKDEIRHEVDKTNLPRVLYQQHASDGVVWWNPDLIFNSPDWISEPKGSDVIDDIFWVPVVTFLQVSVDQIISGGAPDGHGHNYRNTLVDAWASVVPPDDWTRQDSDKLQAIIFQ